MMTKFLLFMDVTNVLGHPVGPIFKGQAVLVISVPGLIG
jgi:hypothetical protein